MANIQQWVITKIDNGFLLKWDEVVELPNQQQMVQPHIWHTRGLEDLIGLLRAQNPLQPPVRPEQQKQQRSPG